MPSPRGPAAREAPQRRQRPLLACGRRGSWGCSGSGSRSRPPAGPRPSGLPHAPTMPAGGRPAAAQAGPPPPPASLAPLLPSEPPPPGALGGSYLRPSCGGLRGGRLRARPPPLLAGAPRGERMLRPLPARRCPPAAAPPGARAPRSALALRARASRPGGRREGGRRGPSSPGRRLRAPRPSRAEPS